MLKHVFLLAAGAALAFTTQAQSRYEGFREAFQKSDTTAMRQVLTAWAKQEPKDPNLYVAKFNYLLRRAERIELRSDVPAKDGFTIKDKKGRTAGSITSGYDPELMAAAQAALRQGIALAPDRLDMRFGLAKAYEEAGDAAGQVQVLREALADQARTKQPWRWFDKAELPAPEKVFVPGSLEEYASTYWQKGGAQDLEAGRQLAELIVHYYPESSLGPFNMGVYYSITKQFGKAYPYLQQADKLQPNDLSTVANLTKLAIELKQKAEAQQYLARLRKLPESKAAADEFARQLRQLK